MIASILHAKYNNGMKNTKKGCDSLTLDKQLCHRLYVTSNAVTRASRPVLEAIDLTYSQYVVMMALWEEDALSVGELQQKTLIDSGCLSLMLKKMVSKDLIKLVASQADKRSKVVYLTEAGLALKAIAQSERDKLHAVQTTLLTTEEFETLTQLLDKLQTGLLANEINGKSI